jgi:hypothetical protein
MHAFAFSVSGAEHAVNPIARPITKGVINSAARLFIISYLPFLLLTEFHEAKQVFRC